jgi:hypothetical protein
MSRFEFITAVLAALHFLSACTFASKAKEVPDTSFYSTSIEEKRDQTVQLTFAPCNKEGCKVMVQYFKDKKLQSEIPLHWPASSQTAYKINTNRWHGAGDPLSKPVCPSWALGDSEHDALVVSVQPVKLSPKVFGLLVHQMAGFEHVRRHHELFLVKDGTLNSVWEQTEAQGPSWSNVVAPSGTGELVYIEGFKPGDLNSADSVTVQYIVWQENKGLIKKSSQGKSPVYLVSIFPFNTVEAAHKFALDKSSCIGSDYMVVNKQNNRLSKFIIGFITTNKTSADKQLQDLSQCIQGKQLDILNFK